MPGSCARVSGKQGADTLSCVWLLLVTGAVFTVVHKACVLGARGYAQDTLSAPDVAVYGH